MNSNLMIFIIITIILLTITIYLQNSVKEFMGHFESSINENQKKLRELPKFYYDIHFKPPPKEIYISNPYACTGSDLRKCKVSDPTSCIGCKNLMANCIHFNQNMEYIDFDGIKHIIPANTDSADDGYCLVTQNPQQKCNPYHGNLVLVQLHADDTESMLYCDCINPGYIGKEDLNGACDEVFVCNGKVVNINTPFDNLECVCENGFEGQTTNGTPVCQLITAEKYTDYANLFFDKEHVASSRFHSVISDNFPGTRLINPCSYCLLTGKFIENGVMIPTQDNGWQCALKNQTPSGNEYTLGVPIRISSTKDRLLKGAEGPDAILAINWTQVFVYGYINNNEYENSAIIFEGKDDNYDIFKRLGLNVDKTYAMDLMDHNVHYPGHFGKSVFKYMARPYCKCSWPHYHCYFNEGEGYNRPKMLKFGNTEFNYYAGTPIPNSFLWGQEFWKNVENNCNPVISANNQWKKNNITKFEINPYLRQNESIKFLFYVFDPIKHRFISVLAKNHYVWKDYNSKLIPQHEQKWTKAPPVSLIEIVTRLITIIAHN